MILEKAGYQYQEAHDGLEALEACEKQDFDAILMDLRMPRMQGDEVCRHLRANPATQHLPIIVISAQTDREDRLRAINSGANDFLEKPIDEQDLLIRLHNVVQMKQQRDQLIRSYRQLKSAEQARDEMTAMMVHEMRNPLIGITGNLELIQMSEVLQAGDAECLDQALRCSKQLVDMVNSLLDLKRLESDNVAVNWDEHDLGQIVQSALDSLGARVHKTRILCDLTVQDQICCDCSLISQVILNIVSNAIDFVPEKDGLIYISACETDSAIRITISDNGPGIPKEDQVRIFDKFSQTQQSYYNGRVSAGLGLAFCKMAVEQHGGSIKVDSEPGNGASFHIRLPRLNRSVKAA